MKCGSSSLKLFLFSLAFVITAGSFANAAVDPSRASWKLYKVYLYTSGGCTGTPIKVLDNVTSTQFDFVANPTIANAVTVPDGTYNCIAIKMDDAIDFDASADDGTNCVSGTTYNDDICQSGGFTSTDADNNSPIACTDSAEYIWIYLSTWSTGTGSSQSTNPFKPPASNGDATQGIKLGSALTVSGAVSKTFVINTTGKVLTSSSNPSGTPACGMDQPTFTFE